MVKIIHKEGHRNFQSSPTITRIIAWRRKSWVGHVERMGRGELRKLFGFGGQSWGKEPTWKPRFTWRMIWKRFVKKWNTRLWIGLIWIAVPEPFAEFSEHGSELFLNKTNRRTNVPNLFCQETLHVSGSYSTDHQEFSTVHSVLV
jgi:hypothetical protein